MAQRERLDVPHAADPDVAVPPRARSRRKRASKAGRRRRDGGTTPERDRPAGPSASWSLGSLEDLVRTLMNPRRPLPRAYLTVIRQLIEPHVMMLRLYQSALNDRAVGTSLEDHLRHVTRAMMSAYLDARRSDPGEAHAWVAAQSRAIGGILTLVDGLDRALAANPEHR